MAQVEMWRVALLAWIGVVPAELRDALALEEQGDDAGALVLLDQRIHEAPAAPLARVEAARIRLKRGEDLDRAELDLEVARSLAPENPRVHFLYGSLMEERGNVKEAIRALEQAVLERADYDDARQRLAGLYFSQGDWPRAEANYRLVTKTHPERTPDRLQLSVCLERERRWVDAELELKKLHDEQPSSTPIARRLAEFYDRTDQPKLAAKIRGTFDPAAVKRHMRKLKKSVR